jgi:hypothetical protein
MGMKVGLLLYPEAQQGRNIIISFPPEKDKRNHIRKIEILILKKNRTIVKPK